MTKNKKSIFKGYKKKEKLQKMTLIFGAKCKDGVCLVGDRKVTTSIDPYTDKIRRLGFFPQIIFTAAGLQPLFEEFLRDIDRNSQWQFNWIQEENSKVSKELQRSFTSDDFKHVCAQTLINMKKQYSELEHEVDFDDALQVLFIVSESDEQNNLIQSLYKMDMDTCYPIPIEQGKIIEIGQPMLGNVFVKSFENREFTMREFARLSSFIIKYVEKEKLSYQDSVGVGDHQPQVWFTPNGDMPNEKTGEELAEILKGIDEEIVGIQNRIGSTSNFLR